MIHSLILVSKKYGKTNKKLLFTQSNYSFTILAYIYINIAPVYDPPNLPPYITSAASLYNLLLLHGFTFYTCAPINLVYFVPPFGPIKIGPF